MQTANVSSTAGATKLDTGKSLSASQKRKTFLSVKDEVKNKSYCQVNMITGNDNLAINTDLNEIVIA